MFKARIHFLADSASHFLPDGQLVTEMEFDCISEIVDYVQEFADAIQETLIMCAATGKIIDLADYTKP